ncbi:hypothetical protein [Corynebacterium sp. MSK072]|uniref:hypothetical protein n=1 Tax=Corynebacterium rhinophilum TaxID=3050197 RepID=UPI00397DDB5D
MALANIKKPTDSKEKNAMAPISKVLGSSKHLGSRTTTSAAEKAPKKRIAAFIPHPLN